MARGWWGSWCVGRVEGHLDGRDDGRPVDCDDGCQVNPLGLCVVTAGPSVDEFAAKAALLLGGARVGCWLGRPATQSWGLPVGRAGVGAPTEPHMRDYTDKRFNDLNRFLKWFFFPSKKMNWGVKYFARAWAAWAAPLVAWCIALPYFAAHSKLQIIPIESGNIGALIWVAFTFGHVGQEKVGTGRALPLGSLWLSQATIKRSTRISILEFSPVSGYTTRDGEKQKQERYYILFKTHKAKLLILDGAGGSGGGGGGEFPALLAPVRWDKAWLAGLHICVFPQLQQDHF